MLELKIPPVALVFMAAGLMWLVSTYAPGLKLQLPFNLMLAFLILLVGLGTCIVGVVAFKHAKTTVNPTRPDSASALVTTGIYSRTRNPMYLGFLLVLLSWAVANANMLGFLIVPAFVLYMNRFQIKPEERALRSMFGERFEVYCSAVSRWI